MQCCVPFCANTSDNASTSEGTGITFHKLPSEENLRAVWLRALGIQDHHLPDPAVVCSQHFIDEDFYTTKSCVRQIQSDAIPSTVQIKLENVVGDVATLVLKREDNSDCMSNANNSELLHEDDNQRDNSNYDCVSEDKYSGMSIKLEPGLVDEEDGFPAAEDEYSDMSIKLEPRPAEEEGAFPATAEHMVEIEVSIKSESTVFGCTLCYEDFVQEDAYKEHMIMHLQDAGGDAACDASQVCEPRAAVSRSGDSLVLQNKTGSQRLSDEPPPAAGCAPAVVAPLSARLAANDESKVQATEEAGAILTSQQILETNIGELDNQSSQSGTKPNTDIYRFTNCQRVRTHTAAKRYSCNLCHYITGRKGSLLRHTKTHTGEKPFSCEICNNKFAEKSHLLNHKMTHTGVKPFSCDLCDYKCTQKGHLLRHIKTHTGEKPFSCDTCNYKCAQKVDLLKHKMTHTGEKPFSCEICNYKCALKYTLLHHMITHTGEKPFSCDTCNYKCVQKGYLLKHQMTHTGEKPFSCEICNYKCAQKCTLLQHIKTHTGEKPFSCEICNNKFAQKNTLLRHKMTHTGEKPFSCEICNYKFSLKGNLLKHMRTHNSSRKK